MIGAALPNPGIAAWRRRVGEVEAERVSLEATTWGTDMHALAEQVGRHNTASLSDAETALIAPYALWVEENVSVFLGVERLVVSHQYGFAGTVDAVVILNGDRYPSILDLKSSKTPRGEPEWRCQLAAYTLAAAEHLGFVCRRRLIVRLPKDKPGQLVVHELPQDELQEDQEIFLSLLKIFNWTSRHEPVSKSIGRIVLTGRPT